MGDAKGLESPRDELAQPRARVLARRWLLAGAGFAEKPGLAAEQLDRAKSIGDLGRWREGDVPERGEQVLIVGAGYGQAMGGEGAER